MQKKIVGLIPARGGSKGVLQKNIRLLGGKPLIEYTINACIDSDLSDCYCSTDSTKIKKIVHKKECKVIDRPKELATDTAPMLEVLKHFRYNINRIDAIMVLYPTYPFRTYQDINKAIEQFDGKCSLIGLHNPKTHPYLCYELNSQKRISGLLKFDINKYYRRQDYPKVYELSHMICIIPENMIDGLNSQLYNEHTKGFIIDDVTHAHNIDTVEDFIYAEWVLKTT